MGIARSLYYDDAEIACDLNELPGIVETIKTLRASFEIIQQVILLLELLLGLLHKVMLIFLLLMRGKLESSLLSLQLP